MTTKRKLVKDMDKDYRQCGWNYGADSNGNLCFRIPEKVWLKLKKEVSL